MIGVAHLDNRLNEHSRLHPKIVLDFFLSESQRLAKADGAITAQKAQDLMETLSHIVSTPAGSMRASEVAMFKRLFQLTSQRGSPSH